MTFLSYPDGSVRSLTALPEDVQRRVWAVFPNLIDALVDHLARSSNPIIAHWGQRLREGDET
jgi:hypothetical protein